MVGGEVARAHPGLRVLVLTRYGSQGGSSRVRFLQYAPLLEACLLYTSPSPRD